MYEKPLPEVDEDTQPYWEGCKNHKLLVQRCVDCATYQSYPRKVCMNCMSDNLEWQEATGRGEIYSFSIVHRASPAFASDVPYVVAIVELDEGVRLMTNIIDCRPEEVGIGLKVQVVFDRVTEDVTLPKFKPIS